MHKAARDASNSLPHPDDLRGFVDYLRDLGVYDLLDRTAVPGEQPAHVAAWVATHLRSAPETTSDRFGGQQGPPRSTSVGPVPVVTRPASPAALSPFDQAQLRRRGLAEPAPATRAGTGPAITITPPAAAPPVTEQDFTEPEPVAPGLPSNMPPPKSLNEFAPLPTTRIAPADKPAALQELRDYIGDCTRCPLAYAGRRSIVFADGDPNARLMFVGEGPGADEDEQGIPFVGKAGQLLNNMIGAMGLRREQVYIANIVECRPPKNRVPEPVEANICSQFLQRQIDIVQPEVIVALGATAATYLLGLRQSLSSLRGQWFDVRGSKCAVTYHPAYLLRDPRQKGEAWKDLQRVMAELKLQPPARP